MSWRVRLMILGAVVLSGALALLMVREQSARYDGKAADEWATLLAQSDTAAVLRARVALGAGGEKAVAVLVEILESEDCSTAVKTKAVDILGFTGPHARPASRPLARLVMESGDRSLAMRATNRLRELASDAGDAVPILVEGLRHGDKTVRILAAMALAAIGPDAASAIPLLAARSGGDDAETRNAFETALAALQDHGSERHALPDVRMMHQEWMALRPGDVVTMDKKGRVPELGQEIVGVEMTLEIQNRSDKPLELSQAPELVGEGGIWGAVFGSCSEGPLIRDLETPRKELPLVIRPRESRRLSFASKWLSVGQARRVTYVALGGFGYQWFGPIDPLPPVASLRRAK